MAQAHTWPPDHPTDRLVGNSPTLHALRAQIRHLAAFDTLGNPEVPTLLLQGETGTGKGLVARVIHDSGPRAHGPFIEVNCAAIPETLLEAEVFGFEAGAFTDARRAKAGLLEAAAGGTLLLDEIDALPLPLQSKLLTALEAKRVRRVGAVAAHAVDVKLIAATQAELHTRVAEGRFRPDLYYRLAVVLVPVPPLRAREEDVLVLAQHFLRRYATAHGLIPKRLSGAAATWLRRYDWPGNVRELSHLMERATLLSPEAILAPETLEGLCLPRPQPAVPAGPAPGGGEPPEEHAQIAQALEWAEGNVLRAARRLELSRSALRHRMRRYGIARPGQAPQAVLATRRDTSAPAPGWEQKPVAVLAIDLTWPAAAELEAPRYEPWTVGARWEQAIAEKVRGFGGVLLQRSPSLLTVAFGIPQTLEQLPQRAVQAALAIRHLLAEARAGAGREPSPEGRLAVHLGQMLVDVQARAPTAGVLAVGETLALPVRLLGHAAPAELLVSAQVGRLLEGWCELRARAVPLGGDLSEPIAAYSVLGLDPKRACLAGLGPRVQHWFVGRERELAALDALWAQIEQGRGQVVGIVGEPGVGKSRLLYEFRRQVAGDVGRAPGGQRARHLEGRCLSYGSTVPCLPVLDFLKAYFQIEDRDTGPQICAKVTGTLLALDATLSPILPALLALLEVPVEAPQWQALDPSQRRQGILEAVKRLLLRESQVQPLVLIVEDLHWIDSETQALLESLVESLPPARVLLLVTYRPEFQHRWGSKSVYTQLRLDPLPPESAGELLQGLLGDDARLHPLTPLLLEWTQGNPFFLEECVRMLVETGVLVGQPGAYRLAQALPTMRVPATVQAVLAARIDRLLPADKSLLQEASVLGHDVPFPLLQALSERSAPAIRQSLAHLQAAEFLYETRLFPEPEYAFKHALTHEVAYGSLLQERRRALHARIMEAIETLTPDRLADQIERLAHHAFRGAVWDKAVAYLHQAGVKAARRLACREAAAYFEQALGALTHLPDSPHTLEQAIDLRLDLRVALVPLKEFGRLLAHLSAAERLAEALNDQRRLGRVICYLANCYTQRGDHGRAIEVGQRALAMATALGDFALQVQTHYFLGQAYSSLGEYGQAMAGVRWNVASLSGELRRESFGLVGSAAVNSHEVLVRCLAEVGAFAEGIVHGEKVVQMAAASEHPYSCFLASLRVGELYLHKGDLPQGLVLLERGFELCQALHLEPWFPAIASALGLARVLAGRVAQAMPLLEQVCERMTAMTSLFELSLALGRLSEALLLIGRLPEAIALAGRGLELARAHQEQGHEAWALRLHGEVASRREPPEVDQATGYYRQALALAEEFGMRPLQARCHHGLSTLYLKNGRPAQACTELMTAMTLYREMDMTFWLTQAEAVLARAS